MSLFQGRYSSSLVESTKTVLESVPGSFRIHESSYSKHNTAFVSCSCVRVEAHKWSLILVSFAIFNVKMFQKNQEEREVYFFILNNLDAHMIRHMFEINE